MIKLELEVTAEQMARIAEILKNDDETGGYAWLKLEPLGDEFDDVILSNLDELYGS